MSEKFEEVKKYFDMGFWTEQKLKYAVKKSWITAGEFKSITGKEYSE
ncbi:MAG: XkdX family protein [Synergistaceae bacterium]|nr:XkdX family protein [Synergistaceae bacterium]